MHNDIQCCIGAVRGRSLRHESRSSTAQCERCFAKSSACADWKNKHMWHGLRGRPGEQRRNTPKPACPRGWNRKVRGKPNYFISYNPALTRDGAKLRCGGFPPDTDPLGDRSNVGLINFVCQYLRERESAVAGASRNYERCENERMQWQAGAACENARM